MKTTDRRRHYHPSSWYDLVISAGSLSAAFELVAYHGLRPVEIYREFITAAARWMMAAKL